MGNKFRCLVITLILFQFLASDYSAARGETVAVDADCYFYGVKYLQKIAGASSDPFLKAMESIVPDAVNALAVLKNAENCVKDGELKGALKAFCVSFKIRESEPWGINFYITFDCAAGEAANMLSRLAGAGPAGNKYSLSGGFYGLAVNPQCAFITNDEKIETSDAAARADAVIVELSSGAGIEEKTVIYKTKFVSDKITAYIKQSMLSLLDKVYEKTVKFELDVIDEDNGRFSVHFPDEESLASNYEVLVGYKDIFTAMAAANSEFEKFNQTRRNARFSAEFSGDMSMFFKEMSELSRKITHKVEGKKLIFELPMLKKYSELNSKMMNLEKKVQTKQAENPRKKCNSNMKTLEGAVELFNMENPKIEKPVTIEALTGGGYLHKAPQCPEGGSYGIECKINNNILESFKIKCGKHGNLDEMM
ncbi:MAG TPA: hypothetical protein PK467_04680 [Candidatus Wallbacteria bacterium]|nr:hypothetical protein [Candidatus Wallbacteria bacterium]